MIPSVERPGTLPVDDSAGSPTTGNSGHHDISLSPERRHALIQQVAYEIAERRGFELGHEIEDWCAAERVVDLQIAAAAPR